MLSSKYRLHKYSYPKKSLVDQIDENPAINFLAECFSPTSFPPIYTLFTYRSFTHKLFTELFFTHRLLPICFLLKEFSPICRSAGGFLPIVP